MKQISNWANATTFDIESDGLLDEATKFHVLSCSMSNGKRVNIKGDDFKKYKQFVEMHIAKGIPVVAHNGIRYDVPLIEKLTGIDCSKLMVIDTLYLSWHLNPDREQHGLDSFLEDYGIAKPKIDSWTDLSYEDYRHRCDSDVDINVALWEDLKGRLVRMFTYIKDQIDSGEVDNKRVSDDEFMYLDSLKGLSVEQHIDRYLTFMMSKADKARLREKTKIKIDKELLKDTDEKLEALLKEAADKLEAVMPKVPKYAKKNRPKKPFLKSGELSASGLSWNEAVEGLDKVDELGNKLTLVVEDDENSVKVLKKYEEPNINSTDQIKKWLFLHGWKPKTFKFVKDKEAQQAWADSGFKKELKPKPRQIPQLSVDGEEGKELCPSVLELASKVPEIEAYSGYTLLKHRYDVIQGFKNALVDDLYVRAEVGGLTNTLREKHRVPVVNLPSVSRPWGKEIRGLLIAGKGQTMLGSDLSSLEDRVKNHFCLAHDPDYVESISVDGYDAHVAMCYEAGFITKEERDEWYKGNKLDKVKAVRGLGKTVNYSSVYGAGAETIARSGGIPLEDAKKLHKAYWKVHAYVKSIADDQFTFACDKGHRWLINPVNGFPYSIRAEKDIFSTLIQGTGSYFFDIWVDNVVEKMNNLWGVSVLQLLMHDELAFSFKDLQKLRDTMSNIIYESIDKVNQQFKLRIDLGCDVQFGDSYAEIH